MTEISCKEAEGKKTVLHDTTSHSQFLLGYSGVLNLNLFNYVDFFNKYLV